MCEQRRTVVERHGRAYSQREGKSVTRSDRRQRELQTELSMVIVDAYGRHPITDDVTQITCQMDMVAPVRAAMPDAPAQYGRPAGPQPGYPRS